MLVTNYLKVIKLQQKQQQQNRIFTQVCFHMYINQVRRDYCFAVKLLVCYLQRSVHVSVCSVVLVQVKQQWVVMRPSTPRHLSSPFLLQKNRDKREESQPEWVWMFQFHWQPSINFNFLHVFWISLKGVFVCLYINQKGIYLRSRWQPQTAVTTCFCMQTTARKHH